MLKINVAKLLKIKFFFISVYLHLVKYLELFNSVNRLVTPGRFRRRVGPRTASYGVRGEK